MGDENLLPLAHIVAVASCEPPRRLWHVPNTHPGYCPGCERKIEKTLLQFNGHDWHPECFRCSLCGQPFKNQGCVPKDDLILHNECYQQCFCERCAKCTELVSPKKAIQALGKIFHQKCFTCMRCGDQDATLNKFLTLYQFPYCNHCFEELSEYFPKCLHCKHVINPSQEKREFFFQGKKYFVHYPDCFKCVFCPEPLTTKNCCMYDNRLICRDCYDKGMAKICAHCNEPIFDQGAKMENIYWHSQHFVCSVCHQPLKPNTCVFRNGSLKCKSCSAEDRAKCSGCGKPVVEQGIHALGAVWHNECLRCQYCKKNVFKLRFSGIRNKPCCTECFMKLKSDGKIDKRGQLKIDHKHHHSSSSSSYSESSSSDSSDSGRRHSRHSSRHSRHRKH
ncbi:hypothetical protein TRFO_07231 [Tritrichomonas foetus]|uniref:LIM zinc-binding domain-containing protein n=1 Tax=Tritrichomonas foetus TaxID=1144522 RepID=A0A1J4JSI5_9EUKA|nr:hypothetical protein TRFO_07231 [Tritrichomonas foetus]|eukprot:OHT02065.1 hypothetical protein TRFO_07231 [Tritrichomonas foetus]